MGTVAVLFIMVIIGHSSAYQYLSLDKGSGGKCTDTDGNLRNVGEEWFNRERCERISCFEMDSKLFQQVSGCGTLSIPSECKTVRDLQADYPDCCPRMQC